MWQWIYQHPLWKEINLISFILTCLEIIFGILQDFNSLDITVFPEGHREKLWKRKGLNLFSWFLSCDIATEPVFSCMYQFKLFGIQMSLPYCIPNFNQAGWQWMLLCDCNIDKIKYYDESITGKTPKCSRTLELRCFCSARIYLSLYKYTYVCFLFCLISQWTLYVVLFLQRITMSYWIPVTSFSYADKFYVTSYPMFSYHREMWGLLHSSVVCCHLCLVKTIALLLIYFFYFWWFFNLSCCE